MKKQNLYHNEREQRVLTQETQHAQNTDGSSFEQKLEPRNFHIHSFPSESWQWFVQTCRERGLSVDEQMKSELERVYSHLVGINAEILNLTRLTDVDRFLKYHVLDSLMLATTVAHCTTTGQLCADVGAGAGYPAIPLMIWFPDRTWYLIESRKKKAAFLKKAISITRCTTAWVEPFRSNEVKTHKADLAHAFQLVVTRAIGDMKKVLKETEPLLSADGYLGVLKGPDYPSAEQSITHREASKRGFTVEHEQRYNLAPEDPERFLAVLRKK